MANPSRRLRIRPLRVIAFFAVFLIAAAAGGNIILAASRDNFLRALGFSCPFKISFGNIFYVPPHMVFVTDVRLRDPSSSEDLIHLPAARIQPSAHDFLRKKRFGVDVFCRAARLRQPQVYAYVRDHGAAFAAWIASLPGRDVRIYLTKTGLSAFPPFSLPLGDRVIIKDSRGFSFDLLRMVRRMVSVVEPPTPPRRERDKNVPPIRGKMAIMTQSLAGRDREGGREDGNVTDAVIAMEDGRLSVSGRLYKEECAGFSYAGCRRGTPSEYRFKGLLTPGGCLVENLEIIRANLYVKLWGDIAGPMVRMKGFSFIDTSYREIMTPEMPAAFRTRLKELIGPRPPPAIPGPDLEKVDVFILDIQCQAKLELPRIHIDRLDFSLNNVPVGIRGDITVTDPVGFSLYAALDPARAPGAHGGHFTGIEVDARGDVSAHRLRCSGAVHMAPAAGIEFDALDIGRLSDHEFRISAGRLSLAYAQGQTAYRVQMRGFGASCFLRPQRRASVLWNGDFYDGMIRGKSGVDYSRLPMRVTSIVRIKDVGAQKLAGLLEHFSKIDGRLSSQMMIATHPKLCLKGSLIIRNGSARDLEFFKWLADQFALPSLRTIHFRTAHAQFAVDGNASRLQPLRLDAGDVSLGGYFILDNQELVSSKLSLGLGRAVLEESPKFAAVLKRLKTQDDPVRFDFQLSGILHTMNFQWLDSPLKEEVQNAIPDFVARRIEKNVENMMDSQAAQVSKQPAAVSP